MSTSAPEKRTDICRIVSPRIEQFEQAAEVCYTRWPYLRDLDSAARFRAFQQLGVELCVIADSDGGLQSVSYLIPSRMELGGETLSWHYMFQLASRPATAGAGAILVRQIMKWYPAIFGMGITPDAERLYQAFRWQHFPGFWRGVHPINLSRMLRDYGERIRWVWLRQALRATAGIYNLISRPLEAVLGFSVPCDPWRASLPSPEAGKAGVLASYLAMFAAGQVQVADLGGVGRILSLPDAGSLRQHAAVWRALRQRDAKFCEMLLFSEAARARAWRIGYVPLALPVWCWDPQGVLARAIPALRERGFTFLNTDKVV